MAVVAVPHFLLLLQWWFALALPLGLLAAVHTPPPPDGFQPFLPFGATSFLPGRELTSLSPSVEVRPAAFQRSPRASGGRVLGLVSYDPETVPDKVQTRIETRFRFRNQNFRFPVSGFGWGSPAAAPCLGGFRFPVFPHFSQFSIFPNFSGFSSFFHIFIHFSFFCLHFSSFFFIFSNSHHFPYFHHFHHFYSFFFIFLHFSPFCGAPGRPLGSSGCGLLCRVASSSVGVGAVFRSAVWPCLQPILCRHLCPW